MTYGRGARLLNEQCAAARAFFLLFLPPLRSWALGPLLHRPQAQGYQRQLVRWQTSFFRSCVSDPSGTSLNDLQLPPRGPDFFLSFFFCSFLLDRYESHREFAFINMICTNRVAENLPRLDEVSDMASQC